LVAWDDKRRRSEQAPALAIVLDENIAAEELRSEGRHRGGEVR
jgi:hypothetical protein